MGLSLAEKQIAIDMSAVEERTRVLGGTLLNHLQLNDRRIGQEWLFQKFVGKVTDDEKLKVELFRFVDTLPALRTSQSVCQHLCEYLIQPHVRLPLKAARGLKLFTRWKITQRVLAMIVRFGARMMAKRFIAGEQTRRVSQKMKSLRRRDLTFSVDLLGEAVTSEAAAIAYQTKYLELIQELSAIGNSWPVNQNIDRAPFGDLPKVNVSIKLSCLYSRFDPMAAESTLEVVKQRLRPILSLAREKGVFVHFDMEQYEFRDITQQIFQDILSERDFRDWSDVGIVVQAYLKDSQEQLDGLLSWAVWRGAPVWVRLVKGAYWDYETIIATQRGHESPVFSFKSETDANYECLTEVLIANWRILRPAIATHNVRSAARAQALSEAYRLPQHAVEYQVLYGMGLPIARALRAQGERVRMYVPIGNLIVGMAYLVRRLLENTSNDSFIRNAASSMSAAELLAAPVIRNEPTETCVCRSAVQSLEEVCR
jgi:RHH-type transcriptional regulator, proline utilization regulon repressor / proline dehydrogenase / delta 1-pyrroline-5-carboxylate dehydrogenase